MDDRMNEIQKQEKPPSIWRCIYPILIYIGAQMVAAFVVMMAYSVTWLKDIDLSMSQEEFTKLLFEQFKANYSQIEYLTLVVTALLLIPLFTWLYRSDEKKRAAAAQEVVRGRVPLPYYVFLVLIAIAYCMAGSNMVQISGLMQISESYQETNAVLRGHGVWMGLIGVGLAAPVMEELLFRGLVFGRMKAYQPMLPAMIFSSLVFAVIHNNLVQGIFGFFTGMLFCYVYFRYRTLWASIVMHAVNNIISVLGSETELLDFLNVFYDDSVRFILFTFAMCLLTVGGVYLVERYVRPCFVVEDLEKSEQEI